MDTIVYGNVTLWNIVVVLIILGIAAIVIQVISLNVRRAFSDKIRKNELEILLKTVKFIIGFVAVISVLPFLSIDLTGLVLAGGFAGLIIGFASQSVVSNLVSGIFLIIEQPIKIGDEILIEGIEGIVEDIRFLSTIMRTYEGVYVRLPNEKVFTAIITNYVADVARRFEYTVGISYRENAGTAMKVIHTVLENHPYVLKHPESLVFVDNLGSSSVILIIRGWTPSGEWYRTKRELLWKIKEALDNAGIEIPYPQQVVWYRHESASREEMIPRAKERQ